VSVSWLTADDAAANSFRGLIYGYRAVDNFAVFKIKNHPYGELKNSMVTRWQSSDGSYHLAYMPIAYNNSLRFPVIVPGRFCSVLPSRAGSVLRLPFAAGLTWIKGSDIQCVSDKSDKRKSMLEVSMSVSIKGKPIFASVQFEAATRCKTGMGRCATFALSLT
jgi:hypothetical protein